MRLFILDLELVRLPKYYVEVQVSWDYLTTKSTVICYLINQALFFKVIMILSRLAGKF